MISQDFKVDKYFVSKSRIGAIQMVVKQSANFL